MFAACSNRPVPKGIIEPGRMESVVYDLLKVDEYLNNYVSQDTSVNLKLKRSVLYEQVFTLHNTNRKEFYTSYRYYQQHPDIQKTLFDSILAKSGRVKAVPPRILPVKGLKVK
jgi:hypothetical protein